MLHHGGHGVRAGCAPVTALTSSRTCLVSYLPLGARHACDVDRADQLPVWPLIVRGRSSTTEGAGARRDVMSWRCGAKDPRWSPARILEQLARVARWVVQ